MNFTATNISSNATANATVSAVLGGAPPLPSLTQRVISAIAISSLIILSVSGNALVIASFYFYKKIRRSVTNCFIVSLAVSDLMVACLSEPFWLSYEITHWTHLPDGWNHDIFLMFWVIMDITCAVASIVNLMFISIDRYFAIKSPLSHHTKMTPETSIWIILGLWAYSIATGCLYLFDWHYKFLLIFIIGFLVPLVIMVFCYSGIMVVISSKARLSNQVGSTRLDKEFKTAKSLGVVTGLFVFCWLPFFIISLVYQYCLSCKTPIERIPAATSAVKWLHYLNSCLNPIIYAFLNPTFKVAFRNLFRKFCTNPNNLDHDTGTLTTTLNFFPNSLGKNRRKKPKRKPSDSDSLQGNGRLANGKVQSKGTKGKLLRFKTPLEESLQETSSDETGERRVNENTYSEKPDYSTQTGSKEPLFNRSKYQDTLPNYTRQHIYCDDDFKAVQQTDPLKDLMVSDTNNNPDSGDTEKLAAKKTNNGYSPLAGEKTFEPVLTGCDQPASSNTTNTTDISTYHDQESNQFYFYVDGELIPDKDIKTSNV